MSVVVVPPAFGVGTIPGIQVSCMSTVTLHSRSCADVKFCVLDESLGAHSFVLESVCIHSVLSPFFLDFQVFE